MTRSSLTTLLFLITFGMVLVMAKPASALTVMEVVRDLACPCECPLVLEDCNMSCGLDWKNQVGEMIAEGKTKQEIMDYFIATYGNEARLTTMQRIQGKIYQYTRGFDTKEWVFLWTGLAIWTLLIFFGIYLIVRKFLLRTQSP